jgi:pimeloyl-ACP methyl ester carboxylesterase
VTHLFTTERPGPPGAPVVVLVHGSLDRSSAFARVQRHLDGLTVVRYDRRGYGRSLAVPPSTSFGDQVTDLLEVVGGRPCTVAGHSLGGVIALAAAQAHPELVRAVVAYEAPMPWVEWWPGSTAGSQATADPSDAGAAAERFMRRMVGDERWAALPEGTRAQRRAEGPALLSELRAIRPPAGAPYDPAAIGVPVLAGCGSRSSPHHQRSARALAAAVPQGELVVVEGADHGVHLTHPAAFADLVVRGLAHRTA